MIQPRPSMKLSDGVDVASDDRKITLTRGALEVCFSREWLSQHRELQVILLGHSGRENIKLEDEALSVQKYLLETGFVASRIPSLCSGTDILMSIRSHLAEWHGYVYGHRLWSYLASGRSTRALAAWIAHTEEMMIHNAAADKVCAEQSPQRSVRSFMTLSAAEEESHAQTYSVFRENRLESLSEAAAFHSHHATTLALSRHLQVMAGSDTLAYLAFSYFLESSGDFVENSVAFYRDVEKSFGLNGLFDPWIEHIQEDKIHGHARCLKKLILNRNNEVGNRVQESLAITGQAVRLLVQCYDAILSRDK